jgi:hypothetical protein
VNADLSSRTGQEKAEKLSLATIDDAELHEIVKKVRSVIATHYPTPLPVAMCQNKAMEQEIEEHRLKNESVTRMKHLQQQV